MKKILGLDLGTTSIGWAVVREAENENETSSIVKAGVRVNPLSSDEIRDFEKGSSITTNADRSLKRGMRRNLSRYKLRREELVRTFVNAGFIGADACLSEQGNKTTFETYRLRAKAVTEEISLEQLSRVLLMINKKRGYKSSRKAKGGEDGRLIDGMDIARRLYDEGLTPGELSLQFIKQGKKEPSDFYRSDLVAEFNRIWDFQQTFYPDCLTSQLKEEVLGKNRKATWAILEKNLVWIKEVDEWDEVQAVTQKKRVECRLKGLNVATKGIERKRELYEWRVAALTRRLDPEQLTIVFQEINGAITSSSGYLGDISDRSKELYFNHQTVGQYLMASLDCNPNVSLKNRVFYRQDYLDEFEKIWEKQAEFHPELTLELKAYIRDVVIFYQRRLKSQKGLLANCEFERQTVMREVNGEKREFTWGYKVIPRSSPLFQEFKIWQTLNNIEIRKVGHRSGRKRKNAAAPMMSDLFGDVQTLNEEDWRCLTIEEKERLAQELFVREKLSKTEVLNLLVDAPKDWELNYKSVDGNRTGFSLYHAFSRMIEASGHEPVDFKQSAEEILQYVATVFTGLGWNTDVLTFDSNKKLDEQPYYRLWHLLYSFEGDNTPTGDGKLVDKVAELCGVEREYARELVAVTFQDDYGSLSAKAIHKILPYMKEGNGYDVACTYAGYRHSAASLTKEEIENKVLKDHLDLLPKNSLRNPVVEKVLNQMVNVVNAVIETYGRPDEIRVELARELKKSAAEREEMTKAIASATKEQEDIKKKLQADFGLVHVSRKDIIRYRLYEELKGNDYKTLYSGTYIPYEKLFSKEFDIEHIIPQARLFDDSFSNKTLELRSINLEKGNKTAYDFVREKYGEEGLQRYLNTCEGLFAGNRTKLRKLRMQECEIPEGCIDRDLRNTQYITKKALSMLGEISRRVVATTGSITDQLRQDWQLVDVMKELNWEKYKALGLVEYYEDRDGRRIGRIMDWTKRNDHRHHAMDALTVAFTKDVFIQYYNNKNASSQPNTNEYSIRNKYFANGRALPPMELGLFRRVVKQCLDDILVSIKAKNKVVTRNVNKTRSKAKGGNQCVQLTPRGSLHKETVYGSCRRYVVKEEKVNATFNAAKIQTVCKRVYREALQCRLQEYNGDAKKAFTGRNTLEKNPIWLDELHTVCVPEKVKTVGFETVYTTRKSIDSSLNIDKVLDAKVRGILKERIKEYAGDSKKAFSNLDENPIWLNKEKGISLRRVTIMEKFGNVVALHNKVDKDGNLILDANQNQIPVDFVNPQNNHHVAIYCRPKLDKAGNQVYDEEGHPEYELEEKVVTFFEAVTRVSSGYPVVDKEYRSSEGWEFLYTLKQNEYFVFPNEKTGFNPEEIDLLNPDNYPLISPNLYRVQKFSSKDYVFRHHLETTVNDNKALQGVTWKRITSFDNLKGIVKVRVNCIGQIVAVGEY